MLLYFTSEEIKNAEHLKQIGLGHIFETTTDLVRVPIFGGPQGFGVVWGSSLSLPESKIGYFPAKQQIHFFGRFGIGQYKGEAFRPESLLRPSAVSHHSWKDHLNREWRIPIARRWVEKDGGGLSWACELPQMIGVDEDGRWRKKGVISKYQELWTLANEYYSARAEAIEAASDDQANTYTFKLPDIDRLFDGVFGVNYRVSKYELTVLDVLTTSTAVEIAKLIVDDPGWDELQKKRTP